MPAARTGASAAAACPVFRRIGNNKGVREGREKGGFLPRIKGVGRTGKGPAAIPKAMLRPLGVKTMDSLSDIHEDTTPDKVSFRQIELAALQEKKDAIKKERISMQEDLRQYCGNHQGDLANVVKFIELGGPREEAMQWVVRIIAALSSARINLTEMESTVANSRCQSSSAQPSYADLAINSYPVFTLSKIGVEEVLSSSFFSNAATTLQRQREALPLFTTT